MAASSRGVPLTGGVTPVSAPASNDIGMQGLQGFGVGICPSIPAGFALLPGTSDPASPNYGNYQCADGSVMVWVPAFWYRIGHAANPTYATWLLNSIDVEPYSAFADVAAAAAAGYALPRAFYNAGAIQPGFFVDKYQCSNNAGVASSLRYGNPLTASSAHAPFAGLTGAPANTLGGAFAAAKTRGARFFPTMRYMHVALALLAMAHAQASASTAWCAWWDGSTTGLAGPKGNNNNALKDANDGAVTYVGDGYLNCGKTGSGVPFAKTTHNGQDCGIADLNGNVWEVSPGITCVASGKSITAATQANPVQITVAAHGFATGAPVMIQSVAGMTQLNDKFYTVTVVDANNLTLDGVNGTAYGAYTSAGTLTSGVWHALNTAADAAALTGGNTLATDAFGVAGVAAHSSPVAYAWSPNAIFDLRYGNGAAQVISPATSGTEWTRANLGLMASAAAIGTSGISAFGQDRYYQFILNELCPLAGGGWAYSSTAGVWAVYWSNARSYSNGTVGLRAASYL
ncbi:conserved hypothetical protein [Leptothrix cholodnii SP-6]|uniref:Ubiquitin-activating enzyme E1 FCCH domain-containing protein n=1 Tax=Leptothrix cholodnii (strain ATCC 51168 / LMG 8142 / SP-6) TaxID=395495 RepID=B1Y3J5_LEPCP|nr:ubiquitin-activating E1 FCCH domain-containing protein [Leptothrix cholodnii]ACB34523.1 conserved hypothetical protein [Leptothrix cholodnii SP-6]